jgi:hypothetical protein
MDFWKAILGLVKRRFVGLPVLGLALIASGVGYLLVPTHYTSSAAMVLTTPTGGGTQDPTKVGGQTNPLLQFNDSLRTTAGILILSMNTPAIQTELGITKGSGITLTVNDGSSNPQLLAVSNNGPFVYIQVDSLSPATATGTVAGAEQLVRNDLTERQQSLNAPKSTYITVTEVEPPSTPQAKRTTKWAAGGLALVGVLFAGFGGVYTADGIRAARRTRRDRQPTPTLRIGPGIGAKQPAVVVSTEPSEREPRGYTLAVAREPFTDPVREDPAVSEPEESGWKPWVGEDTVAMPVVIIDNDKAEEDDGGSTDERPTGIGLASGRIWRKGHRAG